MKIAVSVMICLSAGLLFWAVLLADVSQSACVVAGDLNAAEPDFQKVSFRLEDVSQMSTDELRLKQAYASIGGLLYLMGASFALLVIANVWQYVAGRRHASESGH